MNTLERIGHTHGAVGEMHFLMFLAGAAANLLTMTTGAEASTPEAILDRFALALLARPQPSLA
ncbi:hypothetical protein [Streptomyces longisporoflavus]|uniref:TetR family transcriptional regulator n=1 Tax=Streptomyces longisporoflavus TaxID=28044 RepID=A0ABW7QH33_9ACTN